MMLSLFPDLVVNGEVVPHAQIAAETQNHSGPSGKPGIVWRKAANALAVRTLLLQQARRQEITPTLLDMGQDRVESEEEALIRALLEQTITVEPPKEIDIQKEWQRNQDRFRAPDLWEVSHILIACDPKDDAARHAASDHAQSILNTVLKDPGRFAELARSHSACGSASVGGFLGQISPGDTMSEFETALRDLETGDITQTAVLTRHGWHIIRMDGFARGAPLPFETVRPRIADALQKASWVAKAQAYVSQLVTSAEITGADMKPVS